MALADVVAAVPPAERTLEVVNRQEPDPVMEMLRELFTDAPVVVEERTRPDAPANRLWLRDDGNVLARSPFGRVRDAVLLVNSDIYVTGSRSLDSVETPSVLRRLDDVPFAVDGYPATDYGKFLLIEMSRHIESLAYRNGEGVLHSGFQHLSRIADERGTTRVYESLAATAVETHVYGATREDDRRERPSLLEETDLVVHERENTELRESWFVVYEPVSGDDGAALVCRETDDNSWEGFWSYRDEVVSKVVTYLDDTYNGT